MRTRIVICPFCEGKDIIEQGATLICRNCNIKFDVYEEELKIKDVGISSEYNIKYLITRVDKDE